ncbi:alpha/beta fold hydrolase [Noviherbaspirillum denitrificans]|uniref:Alpha/beta hydrolase n=1 Tax=Noviherbaspirillum denitrificans TaxID=1968433 RepID=A0A254T7T7_9BURK|nr:alpha/beta hydrolase [Noviherbaspirillum denitrificans]OWW18237.1 alpha/beta hydrolase [Noviherbaspirillum denitrificans]
MTGNEVSAVLIPGFMLDESMWDDLAAHLPAGWNLQRARLEGGASIEDIARRIAVEAPERFVLIGFSLGGYVAREIAARFPERVTALVIIASSLREDTEEQIAQKQAAVRASSPATFMGLGARAVARSLHPDRSRDNVLVGRIRAMSAGLGYTAFATQSALRRADIPASAIRCPTLVIAGAQDAFRSPEEAVELRDSIPNAVLEIVDDTGHMIPLEQPEQLAAVISSWVDGVYARPA